MRLKQLSDKERVTNTSCKNEHQKPLRFITLNPEKWDEQEKVSYSSRSVIV